MLLINTLNIFIFSSGLFIIDDKGILRQITVNDLPVGRSVDETLRLVQAFQFTDKHGEGLCFQFCIVYKYRTSMNKRNELLNLMYTIFLSSRLSLKWGQTLLVRMTLFR